MLAFFSMVDRRKRLHREVMERLRAERSDVLDARNAFAAVQTPEQLRRFNAGLRGPLVKGKTSLRFNVDGNSSFDSGTIVAQLVEAG